MNQLEGRLAKIEKAVNNFGGLVYEFRVENALSLQDMAEVVSLSPSYFNIRNELVNGRYPLIS